MEAENSPANLLAIENTLSESVRRLDEVIGRNHSRQTSELPPLSGTAEEVLALTHRIQDLTAHLGETTKPCEKCRNAGLRQEASASKERQDLEDEIAKQKAKVTRLEDMVLRWESTKKSVEKGSQAEIAILRDENERLRKELEGNKKQPNSSQKPLNIIPQAVDDQNDSIVSDTKLARMYDALFDQIRNIVVDLYQFNKVPPEVEISADMLPIQAEFFKLWNWDSEYNREQLEWRTRAMIFNLLYYHILSVQYFGLEDQGDNNEIEIGLGSFQTALFGKFQGK
ncbi:hypothetical protein L207DRAFT_597288 [Hyaloscypha variabilis F]|uniref:Uncharacterized protein n=1 Tax=Hyaloscypha variabilis (strain UAMH 11265 / GT02V1 / F) TaxID=1149755 RepID=A0A2J6RJL6_HYAVF|nr:hypothetical protein L207DRAFT_597288 [Hyaloscypha variabilis F]